MFDDYNMMQMNDEGAPSLSPSLATWVEDSYSNPKNADEDRESPILNLNMNIWKMEAQKYKNI